jgi:hypothetical protein
MSGDPCSSAYVAGLSHGTLIATIVIVAAECLYLRCSRKRQRQRQQQREAEKRLYSSF